jgi:hypothetical protein
MITVQLVAEAIARLRGDRNAYRIASHLNYLGYPVDMNAIRDILGEAHPDMRDDGKPREPVGRRKMSRNRAPSHKGKAL